MTASNAGALFQTRDSFFQKYNIGPEDAIAIAVSGGPDSMALCHVISQNHKGKIYVLCVNHGLRASAVDEISKIQQWVQFQNKPNFSFHVLNWDGEKPDSAVMEAARFARYDLLNNFCNQNNVKYLFVGHHQDDQAETFLMRLINGSGLDGLASIQSFQEYKDIIIYRPFLKHPKLDLIKHCEDNDIPFSQDPSNENANYLRPRMRDSMMFLEKEGLTSKRLANTAKRMARARFALETMAQQALNETLKDKSSNIVLVNFEKLKTYPEEIGLRVIKSHIEFFRPDETYHVRMEKLEDLFEALWSDCDNFKARTLGGCKIVLDKNGKILSIEKE